MRMDLSESPPARGALAAAPPLLQLRGLSKRYGPQTVVDGIDLDIGEGEFVCLLGPSGCGKTTLLRMLCGIETVSSGRVLLRGHDITQTPPAARGFGVVFQSYALFPNLTAMENVAYGLTGLDRARRQARAQEMLDLVGLGAFGARFPSQLSGGQQQRVALARALAPNPGLLLLDEPLSALDAQVRHNLRGEIRRLQRALRIPVIMVTHDQDEALAMADRVVLMDAGRVAQQATPAALYVQPASGFVARFIGRMNLWAPVASGAAAAQPLRRPGGDADLLRRLPQPAPGAARAGSARRCRVPHARRRASALARGRRLHGAPARAGAARALGLIHTAPP
jgi:ABC-type Fe3+/spermidine/putrescine transport system ATPase subunit